MENTFATFIDDLKSTHGANLASVTLYGSAAAGDFIPAHSDYNILIALNEITPKDLRNAHACLREWVRMGHPIPVYFTVSELQNAADVFPIEFHQMDAARKVLFGRDVLAGVHISDKFLRHQTEYELRSKLILLRRQYIPASRTSEGLIRLMTESLATFSSLFRAVLLLKGIEPPRTKQATVETVVSELGLKGEVFEMIHDLKKDHASPAISEKAANDIFADYMLQIERVIASVDELADLRS